MCCLVGLYKDFYCLLGAQKTKILYVYGQSKFISKLKSCFSSIFRTEPSLRVSSFQVRLEIKIEDMCKNYSCAKKSDEISFFFRFLLIFFIGMYCDHD